MVAHTARLSWPELRSPNGLPRGRIFETPVHTSDFKSPSLGSSGLGLGGWLGRCCSRKICCSVIRIARRYVLFLAPFNLIFYLQLPETARCNFIVYRACAQVLLSFTALHFCTTHIPRWPSQSLPGGAATLRLHAHHSLNGCNSREERLFLRPRKRSLTVCGLCRILCTAHQWRRHAPTQPVTPAIASMQVAQAAQLSPGSAQIGADLERTAHPHEQCSSLSCTHDHAKRNQMYVRIGVRLRCPSVCTSTSWSTQEHT